MLFGDAATATWMGEGAAWQLGKSLFGSDGVVPSICVPPTASSS